MELEDIYEEAVKGGLDLILDKEAKSISRDLHDLVERLKIHRQELKYDAIPVFAASLVKRDVSNYSDKSEPYAKLVQLMIIDSRVVYITLETPKKITSWLERHS